MSGKVNDFQIFTYEITGTILKAGILKTPRFFGNIQMNPDNQGIQLLGNLGRMVIFNKTNLIYRCHNNKTRIIRKELILFSLHQPSVPAEKEFSPEPEKFLNGEPVESLGDKYLKA
jgi:hypothetical protein